MSKKDDILKQNLAFVYGRNNAIENQLPDPDKIAIIKTDPKPKDDKVSLGNMILRFEKEWEALHPCYQTPVQLKGDNNLYPSFEHALQASKFLHLPDRETIRTMEDIREVKRFVAKNKNQIDLMVPNWNEHCLEIAKKLLRDKFFRTKSIKMLLIKTGHKYLHFENDYQDMFWGQNQEGKGQNHLGKLLELIRKEIDQGNDIDLWIQDQVNLYSVDKTRIELEVTKDGLRIEEDSKTFDKKVKLFIGKGEFNDILGNHPSISRVHALIVITDQRQSFILDLGSANGTMINQQTIPSFVFTPFQSYQDILQFGASNRMYRLSIDYDADIKRKQEIVNKIHQEQTNGNDQENTVFIRNLSDNINEFDLEQFFAPCGTIVSINLPKDKQTKDLRGFAFVTFASPSGVLQAISRDGDELKGKYVKIKKSDATKPMPSSGTTRPMDNYRQRAPIKDNSMIESKEDNEERNNHGIERKREQENRFRQRSRSPKRPREEREDNRDRRSRRDSRSRSPPRRRDSRSRERKSHKRSSREDSHSPSRKQSRIEERDSRRKREISQSPPRRKSDKYTNDRSESPPRRSNKADPSPPRRKPTSTSKSSPSPPRNNLPSPYRSSPSQSPPRRKQQSPSPSPPRRNAPKPYESSPGQSQSPPRKRQQSPSESRSVSPPRRNQASNSSQSPPRRTVRSESSPSPSPPRRKQSPSPSPPRRKSRFDQN